MDTRLSREVLNIIKSERSRRRELLAEADSEYAYDKWHFEDLPFVNELCLTLLVAVLHQIERKMVLLAARVTHDTAPISEQIYRERVRQRREEFRRKKMWHIASELGLCVPDWLEALRLLANCYKHDPMARPDEDLLKHLKLPLSPTAPLVDSYAPMVESEFFLNGLAAFLGIGDSADYCAVTEELISRADQFMTDVEGSRRIVPVVRR
jgi:hypothetical protein